MAIDDELLAAFADGELDPEQRALVARALLADPQLRGRLDAHRQLRQRLSAHYAPVVEEAVPERLSALITARGEDATLVPFTKPRRAPAWRNLATAAAALVLGLAAGIGVSRDGGGPIAVEDGVVVARGGLAEALTTQLASAGQAGDTRIGISFAAGDGRICRTFTQPALSGLACRGAEDWQVLVTSPGAASAGGGYRQASSGDMLVLQAAEAMMAGAPMDAAAEQRARDSGWSSAPASE